jgi:TPR repeat protein
MMKKMVCGLGLALVLALLAGGAQARTDGEKAVAGIGERLRASDCAGAVKALNSGLQAGYPEVALMAGTLFETGRCLNRNWDKAVGLYVQAYDGGIRAGALRLSAGFAAAANGPDAAASLWWAKRARLNADTCTADLPDTDDPDRFVDALRTWPAQKLETCNYVVGTMAFIVAEARYPMEGIAREIMGRPELVFTPARMHFRSNARDATRPARDALNAVIVRAISLAGARYRTPEGIPLSWEVPFVIEVDTDKSRWW